MDFFVENQDLLLLVLLGILVVCITRYALTLGVEWLADSTSISPKLKGKILGFSTSVPELVATTSTAAMGLIGAGLWNIAASNILNSGLFLSAMLWYRQYGKLVRFKFLDEISFVLSAVGLPVFLSMSAGLEKSPYTAAVLFSVFLLYLWLDKMLNRHVRIEYAEETESISGDHSVAAAVGLIALGVAGITVTGYFLGYYAERVVVRMEVPEVAVGWILGVITSLPELTSFFAVFGEARRRGERSDASMQANLDSLAASNWSNLGLIFPIGITVFLIASALA
jgi:Ca2+/Na+ antiporter